MMPADIEPTPGSTGVLVVDDDERVRRLCARTLRTHGFHVVEAASGQEAIDIITRHAPDVDVVITDIVMPDLDGIELAARLRASYPDLTIVLMSGYAPSELFRRNALALTLPLLRKPFLGDELYRMARDALDKT